MPCNSSSLASSIKPRFVNTRSLVEAASREGDRKTALVSRRLEQLERLSRDRLAGSETKGAGDDGPGDCCMADPSKDETAKDEDSSSLDSSETASVSVSIFTELDMSALLRSMSSLIRLIRIIVDPFSFASWASTSAK